MKKQLLVGAALLAAIPGSVMAADLSRPAPAPAPVYTKAPPPMYYSWSGCYVGGHVGGDWSSAAATETNVVGAESFTWNPSSWIGGGQLGCQYQMSSVVLGVEGTWSGTKLNQTDPSVLQPGRLRSFKLDEIATVTGRLGFAADRWMIYGKGGWADGRIDTLAINPATGISFDNNQWQTGWTVGGGIEWMAWQNFILGAEVNYYRFKFDASGFATDGTPASVSGSSANVYSAMVRASWLLNWGGPVVARY
jgi:outer membrane immunogenic protein